MTLRARQAPATRAGFHQAAGVLLVVREPPPPPPPAPGQPPLVPGDPAEGVEILLALWDDDSATALSGKVDLGTGVRTALAQLVAEELDLGLDQVHMVLGDTARAPNQGPTIASATIQIASAPQRQAAAQARRWLLAEAAARLAVPVDELCTHDGAVHRRADDALLLRYAELLTGRHVELVLDERVALKPAHEWRVAGQPLPRVDIPAKVFGEAAFVHDQSLPGMLHGRVVRPPYAGADHGDFIGRTLAAVDEASVAHVPGLVAVVREGDFVGVVAEREEQAEQAMRQLRLQWHDWPGQPPLDDLAQALRANPATPRVVAEQGDVAAANASAPLRLQRRYVWPYQLHASIGPSCALADWRGDRITVWAGTQNPHVLRADIALLLGLPDTAVEIVRLEAAGCYGRNGADDVAADAALLSRAVGRPVRVQLTREQEHLWEPKGAAQLMEVDGSLDDQGRLRGWDFHTRYPSNASPTLALLLTGRVPASAQAYAMGDRTSVPPYRVSDLRVTVHDMPPILRASWLRGVSALPNSFAHECFVDELAHARGEDPLAFRLRHLDDERARDLLQATAERAGWQPRKQPGPRGDGVVLQGRGLAWARYVHSKFPGFGAAWSAWVADVEVNRVTGEVHVARIVVGHDAGAMVNPAGVQHQVHGNVLQTTSRALLERVAVEPERGAVATREWGSYPILAFRQVPVVEVVTMPRPGEPMLGAGESSSVPGTAAIANAIFDATGVRLREPPFTPEVVRAALNPLPPPPSAQPSASPAPPPVPQASPATPVPGMPAKPMWAKALALAGGAVAALAAYAGWRPAIAPVSRPDASIFTAATLERGRAIAAIGNCVGCHTVPGGAPLAGGRALATPFGAVHSSNLTPDVDTGIGAWSFDAFRRAMREGVSRDGRHLFPAFPYTAFTRMPDDELMALYAWLMAQPAVAQATPQPSLAGVYGQRALLPLWNALHLQPGPRAVAAPPTADASRWARGEYLVNGPGHCGACHTPRDALGAERADAHLAGAQIDGWTAPSLTAAGRRTLPWTESTLFGYLRQGHSAAHGVASGPMAEVVSALSQASDDDLRAMAHYLVSLQGAFDDAALQRAADAQVAHARSAAAPPDAMQRFFDSACGACHSDGRAAVELGLNLPLALNGKLHDARPDDLLRVLLDGIQRPATREIGFMPGFRHALDDRQLADLAVWLRRRYAPAQPAWGDAAALRALAARVRAEPAAR